MPVLTDADRAVIAKARELAAITKIDDLRERYGEASTASIEDVFVDLWGESVHLLIDLAVRLERLGGG